MTKEPLLASCVFALPVLMILVGTSFELYDFGFPPIVAAMAMIAITLVAVKFALPVFLKHWNECVE